MYPLHFLFLLLVLVIILEAGPLPFFVLLVVSFVFLGVLVLVCSHSSSLVSFLVWVLYLIIFTFLRTQSLLVFFIMYELSLVPVCLLILLFGYQPEKISSFLYLLLYTVVCSAPFFFFTILSFYSSLSGLCSLGSYSASLVCLSFMVKSPLYTLHSWLPKAHVEAPLFGSMLLAGVILKLGSYGLLLLAPALCLQASVFVLLTLSGGIVCSVICCRHWDIKSLVAYSSVVHIGAITLGALSGSELGY